jgi:hypothetical protein
VIAADVTSDGRHLAILYLADRLLLIQDWEQCLKSERPMSECSLEIIIRGARNEYLAVADGRVALATVRPFTFLSRKRSRSRSDEIKWPSE